MTSTDTTLTSSPARGADLINDERRRQIEAEGWTLEHDLEHGPQVLAAAACAYETGHGSPMPPLGWPWHPAWWKPKDELADLVRAGALYYAAADAAVHTGYSPDDIAALVQARDRVAALVDDILAAQAG